MKLRRKIESLYYVSRDERFQLLTIDYEVGFNFNFVSFAGYILIHCDIYIELYNFIEFNFLFEYYWI